MLPPLRERGADEIEPLARPLRRHVRASATGARAGAFDADALAALRAHDWPGNVRELEHWVESAIVLAPDGTIRVAHFPAPRARAGTQPPATRAARFRSGSPSKKPRAVT